MSTNPLDQIQSMIDTHATNHIGVVAGLISPNVNNGSPTLLFAGKDDLLNTKCEQLNTLDGNTPFKLASITKIFTSVVQFQIHGGYDGRLKDYIKVQDPKLPDLIKDIPIIDLANYSPGFPTDNQGLWEPSSALQSLSALLNFLAADTPKMPQYKPGSCYSYSNFGWGLLAIAALGVTDPFADIYGQWGTAISNLGKAVGFQNTAPYDPSIDDSLPIGHDKNGNTLPCNADYGLQNPMLFGAGSVVTTGYDMLKWLELHMGLADDSWKKMLKVQQAKTWQHDTCANKSQKGPVVSLGWFHRMLDNNGTDVTFLSKDGGHMGFTSWMGFEDWIDGKNPSSTGCFILTNSSGADQLGSCAVNYMLGNSNPVVTTAGVQRVEADG